MNKWRKWKKELWNKFFPGEEMPERYMGAVDEYEGILAKELDIELSEEEIEEIING